MSPSEGRLRTLARSFYRRPVLEVGPELLNKVLVHGPLRGRIVEVEAYDGANDPASHAYRGRTDRNRTMFGPAGHLYVYFTYGMHWCANVVCGERGEGCAVLLRALAPLAGVESMRRARSAARTDRDLCSGPAKLCQALGIDRRHDGVDLAAPSSPLRVCDDRTDVPTSPGRSRRVGISVATERPWRFFVVGDPNLSRRQ